VAAGDPGPELATVRVWLLDTGSLVAYLDGSDPAHESVASRLDAFTGRLATTSAVVTEAMHFVSHAREGPRLLAEFLSASDAEVADFCRPAELAIAAALMERYSDVPMDFADATLVLLAEALSVRDVLTLDRRGFSAYRTRGGRALRLVLDH
jgi:predicted nucleic acid-binding protein